MLQSSPTKTAMNSSTSTFVFQLLTVLFLTFSLPGYAAMSVVPNPPTFQQAVQADPTAFKDVKVKKIGFFKRIRMVWEAKKAKMRPTSEGEKASTLAKAALFLFIGSIGLSLLLSAVSTASAVISTIASLAMLASLVIALIVLFGDENRKSKAIAKAIVIVWGVMLLLSLLFLVLIITAFSGW